MPVLTLTENSDGTRSMTQKNADANSWAERVTRIHTVTEKVPYLPRNIISAGVHSLTEKLQLLTRSQ